MRELEREVMTPEQIGEGLLKVPAGSALDLDVRLESLHDGILATANVVVPTAGECSRCLTTIDEDLQVEFTELFAYARDEALEYEVSDDCVDLEPPIRDAVVLALPFQPVCQPDCLGLDPETGEKLTQPRPERASEVDPRWASLLDFDASEPGQTPASE
ncbi:YceD family protein [Pseudoclavibacter endophyticus]|uniref:DUF177 domain-containing protein n=1 Tax=Pseudoclavibacter endophyticus TaxID=1778590 RepID=A0A6H9WEG2_9MICO|nr:YceD family protein [Pseudoclavibacter endophyticus]KAB1649299.1 DUF177 domain-containing protein [Pseudoclavibacter endophyticus]